MVVVISRFTVANGMETEVAEAFVARPHRVDDAEGFVRLDVVRPHDNPSEYWLMTYWTDSASYETWYRSHRYHDVHDQMPEGLKLVPGSVEIRTFDHVTS